MKNIIKKSLFSALTLILAISLVFPSLNVSAKNKDEGKYEVKVSYGIDGKYRAMKHIPVTVNMKSLEKDFEGEIEIRVASSTPGSYDAFSMAVKASKDEEVQVTIPATISAEDSKFTVNIIEDGKSVSEKSVMASEGRITEGNLFVGLLTDDMTSLGYLGDVTYTEPNNPQKGGINTVKLDSNSIGSNHLNIDGLDVIFINNFNMGGFTKEHYNSLNAWINKGGTLVIGSGINESKTVKSIDKSLLGVKSNGTSEKNITLVNEALNLAISDLDIDGSKVILGSEGEELVYSVSKGKGEILVTTFDLGMEPLISSKDATEVWNKLLIKVFEKVRNTYMYGGGYRSYEMESLIRNIPVDKVVNVWVLAAVLIGYALIVGVALYIILKKMKKRDLIWGAVPVIAIGFSLIVYLLGTTTRVNDLILNQVNIIDVNESGKGQVKSNIGIGSKYKEDISIEKPENIAMNFKDEQNFYYGMQQENVLKKLRVKTTYRDSNAYFDFEDSDALDMKRFEVVGNEQSFPKIESSFNYDGGKLNGKVKNNLDANIERLILVSGENVWDLGEIKVGEELNVDQVEVAKSSGIIMYGDDLNNKYWDAKYNHNNTNLDIKAPEFKNITRHGSLLRVLSEEIIFGTESKLIAITDMPIDYEFDFGKKTISKYDTTILMQGTEIDFKDKDGNTNYPKGYFKGVVESTTSTANADEYSGDVYGTGEVIYNFKVNDEVDILNIDINRTESKYNNEDVAEYFIYNYKNNDYEKITLEIGKGVTLASSVDYSKDNNIKIKIVVSDKKGLGRIPTLTIKGRVK
ncbi:MAG: hypothetical protein RSD13_05600 [Clostridium sp.]